MAGLCEAGEYEKAGKLVEQAQAKGDELAVLFESSTGKAQSELGRDTSLKVDVVVSSCGLRVREGGKIEGPAGASAYWLSYDGHPGDAVIVVLFGRFRAQSMSNSSFEYVPSVSLGETLEKPRTLRFTSAASAPARRGMRGHRIRLFSGICCAEVRRSLDGGPARTRTWNRRIMSPLL